MNSSPASSNALSHPVFRALWLVSVGSGIGSTVHDTAAVWSLTLTTDKAWVVTLFQALLSAPLLLFALPAGALADIVDKRLLVLRVNLAGAVIAFGMAIYAFFVPPPPVVLLGGAFLFGTILAFALPAWQSLMPEVIEKPMMSSAITLGSIGVNLSRAIGPMFGGLIVGSFGPAPAFLVNAISYVAVAAVLLWWRRPAPAAHPHAETVLGAMVAAARYVRHSRPIQYVLVRHALFAFSAFAPIALLPLFVKALGLPGSQFGMLMGTYGAGGIIGAVFILPRLRRNFSVDRITLGAGVVALLSLVPMPFVRSQYALAAILFPAGAAWLLTMAQLNFAGQSVFPHWIRARASAIQLLCFQGAIAVGALIWGYLTSNFGLAIALFAAAGGLIVYLVATVLLRVDQSLEFDLTPIADDHFHNDLVIQPHSDDGPVRVAIRYEVQEADEPAFLSAIAELRESRLRDGAYRWNLWRDLKNPRALWEIFLVGSWQEHLRRADRMTTATRQIEDRVLSFHRGSSPPEVQHFLHIEPSSGGGWPFIGQPMRTTESK